MKITIVGGGNIGTQFAVHTAEKGHEVIVYTSVPDLFDRHLEIVDETGTVTHAGDICFATNDPQKAFSEADIIFITLPSMMMSQIADIIYDCAGEDTFIGVVPGNGGSECAFRKCIERGNVFFGIERVPAIARLVEKGKRVKSTGYRDELHVASLPSKAAEKCAKIVNGIFDIPCEVIPSFLNLTMTPSNPILHTTRLKVLFKDWKDGVVYKSIPLFYQDWDDESSELLFLCDEEVQNICRALPEYQLEYVRSLKDHYESHTVQAMTAKISGIEAFKGLKTPALEVEGGYIPDLHSRYFTADFSYGLTIIRQVADFAGVSVPNIDELMAWYKSIAIEKDEFRFSDYGIEELKGFEDFYLQ